MLEEKLEVIPEHRLIKDRLYLGRGRNRNIGLWDGKSFITFCYKFNFPSPKHEGHLGADYQGGCFQPFLLLETREEMLAKYKDMKVLPKKSLEEERFYFGIGKGAYICCWGKDEFLTWKKGKVGLTHWTKKGPQYIGELVDGITVTVKKYGKDFKPLKKIDEGWMIEPFEDSSSDNLLAYGKTLLLRTE